jgi:type IV pilus assembly protein PilV
LAASQKGFSLLEALITIVVVAIGLLGVAGMQVASIKLADLSQTRATGTVLMNDIIDRIRANRGAALDYATAFGSTATAGGTLAERDINAWKTLVRDPARGLSNGDGQVVVAVDAACTANCISVTVTLRWDESRQRGGRGLPQTFSISTRV